MVSSVLAAHAADDPAARDTRVAVIWVVAFVVVTVAVTGISGRAAWSAPIVLRHGPQFLRARRWSGRNAVATSSAGIRGVVTLIAVSLLPPQTENLEFLRFLALIVVIGMLLEGLLLPAIVRALKLPSPN